MQITGANFLTHSLQHFQINVNQYTVILTLLKNTFLTLCELTDWFYSIYCLKFDNFFLLAIYADFLFYHVLHFLFVLNCDGGWGWGRVFGGVFGGFHVGGCCGFQMQSIFLWICVRFYSGDVLFLRTNIWRNFWMVFIIRFVDFGAGDEVWLTVSTFSGTGDHHFL